MANQRQLRSKLNNANISRLKFMFTNTEDGHLYQATEKTKKKMSSVDLTQEEHDRLMEWVVKVGNTFLTNPDVYEHPISMDRFRICVYPKSRRVIADIVGGTRRCGAIITSWDSLFTVDPAFMRSIQVSSRLTETSRFRQLVESTKKLLDRCSPKKPIMISTEIDFSEDCGWEAIFKKPMHQIAAALSSDHIAAALASDHKE